MGNDEKSNSKADNNTKASANKFEVPIISIITPYFNAQEYIEETAKSVLNQTFPYFEWIIVDDGSNAEGKGKLKEIEQMDNRIKVIESIRK